MPEVEGRTPGVVRAVVVLLTLGAVVVAATTYAAVAVDDMWWPPVTTTVIVGTFVAVVALVLCPLLERAPGHLLAYQADKQAPPGTPTTETRASD